MMTTTNEDLYTPLLGDENFDEQESVRQEQEQDKSAGGNNKDDDCVDYDDLDDRILRYECFIFPFLLFAQFGMTFLRSDHGSSSSEMVAAALSWGYVSCGIILLTATIWLYREACADSKLDQHYSLIFVFLPEILINIILLLALFDKVTMAYAAVLVGGLFLAIVGFVATVHFIMCSNKGHEQDEEQEEISTDDSKQVDAALLIV